MNMEDQEGGPKIIWTSAGNLWGLQGQVWVPVEGSWYALFLVNPCSEDLGMGRWKVPA